tara:strand:- start:250 stop:531 length:282 start_codon:yes stop_codon:yes gene_type:complete
MVQYAAVSDIANYRIGVPQSVDPLEHLYRLERDMDAAERRTMEMIRGLSERLDSLETRVSSLDRNMSGVSRQLETELVALAERIASLETGLAA